MLAKRNTSKSLVCNKKSNYVGKCLVTDNCLCFRMSFMYDDTDDVIMWWLHSKDDSLPGKVLPFILPSQLHCTPHIDNQKCNLHVSLISIFFHIYYTYMYSTSISHICVPHMMFISVFYIYYTSEFHI